MLRGPGLCVARSCVCTRVVVCVYACSVACMWLCIGIHACVNTQATLHQRASVCGGTRAAC